jgi:hypothetical protein
LLYVKKPEAARRYYQSAAHWLDKAQRPLWACNLAAAGCSVSFR